MKSKVLLFPVGKKQNFQSLASSFFGVSPTPVIKQGDEPTEWLSLDDYVSTGSGSLLYVRVHGESMVDLGIETGDLVVVDRLVKANRSDLVLVSIGNIFTIKKFADVAKSQVEFIGVVTHCVRRFREAA